MLTASLKAILTTQEKYLVKNQKKFAIDSASSSSDESEIDFDPNEAALIASPYALKLAQGVKQRRKSLMSSYRGTTRSQQSHRYASHINQTQENEGVEFSIKPNCMEAEDMFESQFAIN